MKIVRIERSRDWLWPAFALAMWSTFFMAGCDMNHDPVQRIPQQSPTPTETIYSGTLTVDPGAPTRRTSGRARWTPPPGQS